jgi:hypothetical protein
MEVGREGNTVTLEQLAVVKMAPLEDSFLERLDFSTDLGFSFTQANQAAQWNLNANASYRSRQYLLTGAFSSLFTGQEGADSTVRNELRLQTNRFFGRRWFGAALANLLQSEELRLELRSLLGGGIGRYLVQNNRLILAVLGGAAYSRERFKGSEPGRNNAEAVAGLQVEVFTFEEHETDFTTTFIALPNLSTTGRIRLELNSKFRRELFGDFTWNVQLFDSYDSDPPSEGAKRNDFGVSTVFIALPFTPRHVGGRNDRGRRLSSRE